MHKKYHIHPVVLWVFIALILTGGTYAYFKSDLASMFHHVRLVRRDRNIRTPTPTPTPKVKRTATPRPSSTPVPSLKVTESVLVPTPTPTLVISSLYPWHMNITATVFWVGEPQGAGSSEDNSISAWDDTWEDDFGGFDDPQNRNGYFPVGFTPKENPFYLDLPYNDFNDNGTPKTDRLSVIPWAVGKSSWSSHESLMKNRWVELTRNGVTCYGQIEDAGPYQYNDSAYVFGDGSVLPKNTRANNAGLDVSPALRDCLQFEGWNNAENRVNWRFIEAGDVPAGPWKQIVTMSQINWP